MSDPTTPAGRALLRRHAGLSAAEVEEIEREARTLGVAEASQRRARVLERLGELLTADQFAAASAVLLLDPVAAAGASDRALRTVLAGLADRRLAGSADPETLAAARRLLTDII
ncbi:MAG: hypothetical protein ACXW4H_06075 [Candidatus Limnocylindrales bacterium]